jgi:hypothetical protein
MTAEHKASRTLVKSTPELWAECSVAASLARHLGQFGEIKITRLEPETAVAWEGERASGTVRLEPSGWGTHVTLTARGAEVSETAAEVEEELQVEVERVAEVQVWAEPVAEVRVEAEPVAVQELEPVAEIEAVPEPIVQPAVPPGPRRTWLTRFRGLFAATPPAPAVVEDVTKPPEPPEPVEPPEASEQPEPIEAPEPAPARERADVAPEARERADVAPEAVLAAALDSLGQAHHRPFSRA